MYIAQTTKDRIKELCKVRNCNVKKMLLDCSLGINAIQQINDNKGMASTSLAKIADYLDCSVDYLLGRIDNPNIQANNIFGAKINNSFVGDNSANVTVNNGNDYNFSAHEFELLRIYRNLSIKEQTELLSIAFEMESRSLK